MLYFQKYKGKLVSANKSYINFFVIRVFDIATVIVHARYS